MRGTKRHSRATDLTPELQAEWDRRLRESGFRDIEQRLRNGQVGDLLLGPSPGDLARGRYRTDKEEYYRWAGQHLHRIEDPVRHKVWELHAQGLSNADVYEIMRGRWDISIRQVPQIVEEEARAMQEAAAAELDAADEAPRTREEEIMEVYAEEVGRTEEDLYRRSRRRDPQKSTRGFWDPSRATGIAKGR